MQPRFVHLRLHSEYSLIDGLVRIKPLMKTLPERGMNSVAVTDHCNLFAAVKVFQSAIGAGVKPIIGSDIPIYDPDHPNVVYSLLLLCQNDIGYKNLTRLVSKAYQQGQYQGEPRVHIDWLEEYAQGLIALSGGPAGDVGKALLQGDEQKAQSLAKHWMSLFPNRYYLEIQRTDREGECAHNEGVVKLAEALNLPLVATNDVRFIDADDFDAHEARVCIHDSMTLADPRREKRYSANHQACANAFNGVIENILTDFTCP